MPIAKIVDNPQMRVLLLYAHSQGMPSLRHIERRGDELSTVLQDLATRQQRVREGKTRVEAERKRELAAAARPAPKVQRNFTDPEARSMKTADGFQQCENAKGVVTVWSQLMVAGNIVHGPDETPQLQPMVDEGIANVGVPNGVIADSGYWSEATCSAGNSFCCISLRGVEGVKGECQLACSVHNLVKLRRTGADAVRRMPSALSVRFAINSATPSST